MTIYFDMDGTIADFYNFPDWLPLIRAGVTKPYRHCAPIGDNCRACEVMRALQEQGVTFTVLSWGAMDGDDDFLRRTARAKQDWLRVNYPGIFRHNRIVHYGTPKESLVDAFGAILFDDNRDIGEAWAKAGGRWCDVKEVSFIDELEKILEDLKCMQSATEKEENS